MTEPEDEFFNHLKELEKSKNTIMAYKADLSSFKNFINQPLWPAPKNVLKLTKDWLTYLSNDKSASLRTIQRRLVGVKTFYSFMGAPHLLNRLRVEPLRAYTPKILTFDETEVLLKKLVKFSEESKLFFEVMLLTGVRFEELMWLKPDSLNREENYIELENRRVFAIPQAFDLLESWQGWTQGRGRKLNDFSQACILIGLGKQGPSLLRSTCAARMISINMSLPLIEKILDFKSSRTLKLIEKEVKAGGLTKNYTTILGILDEEETDRY